MIHFKFLCDFIFRNVPRRARVRLARRRNEDEDSANKLYTLVTVVKVDTFKSKNLIYGKFVGNKAKGRISKRMFQENRAHQIFRKTNISYPPYVCVSGRKKCSFFRKFDVLCFLETPVLSQADKYIPVQRFLIDYQACHK